jgi:lactate dehydrogenase-like 2-hydroxyacid dehydrogenase
MARFAGYCPENRNARRITRLAKVEVLALGDLPAGMDEGLSAAFSVHRLHESDDAEPLFASAGEAIRGIARGNHFTVNRNLMERLPNLQLVANNGVGYDGIDLAYAAEHGIIVTNTPDVLTEEVADTALGLLLMTVRELPSAEQYLRSGEWARVGPYRLARATLRDRTVGIVGLGRIGLAIARRLDAMHVPVVYHNRHKRDDVEYRHYPDLKTMATEVDTLIVVLPGSPATGNLVDASILQALGPNGILINIGRGSVVDEPALIEALRKRVIYAAGLDVFAGEPHVPDALLALPNAVLLPHVGSASVHTRRAMAQLVVDNLKSWFDQGKPLTPVAETPWPRD